MNNFIKLLFPVLAVFIIIVSVALFTTSKASNNRVGTLFTETSIEEQVQKLIVAGKLDEVPEGMNKSKKLLINEYMRDCYLLEDDLKSMECFEFYYINNKPDINAKSEECKRKTGAKKDLCMDEYYMALTEYHGHVFCAGIKDEALKKTCLETVE